MWPSWQGCAANGPRKTWFSFIHHAYNSTPCPVCGVSAASLGLTGRGDNGQGLGPFHCVRGRVVHELYCVFRPASPPAARTPRQRAPRKPCAPPPGRDVRYLMRSCPCFFRFICDETFAVHFFFSIQICLEDCLIRAPALVKAHVPFLGLGSRSLPPCLFSPFRGFPNFSPEGPPLRTMWPGLD